MNSEEINEIAHRLTQQWINILRDRVQRPNNAPAKAFLRQLELNGKIVFLYENRDLLDKTLDHIPLQRLYEEAELQLEKNAGESSLEDGVIQKLLHWFKKEFFTWVNNVPCEYCQSTQTKPIGNANPTAEDLKFGARVVETYQCMSCNRITRFPRYNDPEKLLETRRGRCGEWANCFTLCCRAVGSESRIVYDATDHVWTEVYSEHEQRWIHCDSCEGAWDTPLMYSVGWNKQLSYCTAFSVDEALDVTKRYTRNWREVLKRRNKAKESQLALFLDQLTIERQQFLDDDRKHVLSQRRIKELLELEEASKQLTVKEDEMLGRQSGSLQWRTSRGETGQTCSAENIMTDLSLEGLKPRGIPVDLESQVAVIGSASILSDNRVLVPSKPYIRLTKAIPDQRGGVYCKETINLDDNLRGLEVEFAFRITDSKEFPAINGADGFAFVIQAQGANILGEGGCQLGFGGITHCLAIEFDTYKSSDRCDDPSGNHISVQARKFPYANSAHHDYSLGYTSRIPFLQSGQWLKAKIRLMTNGTIEIGLGEVDDKRYIQVLKVANQNFLDYTSRDRSAWVGFTASTGGLAQNHDVQWLSITEFTSK